MPLFEYVCKSCQHRFEALVRSDTSVSCPSCQGHELQKALSVFAVKGGSDTVERRRDMAAGACSSCGDPRGPGACALN